MPHHSGPRAAAGSSSTVIPRLLAWSPPDVHRAPPCARHRGGPARPAAGPQRRGDHAFGQSGRARCSEWEPPRSLTCDHSVTYLGGVSDDDRVFKALADPTRRFLLDLLFERDGRTLTELESELEMTRFGVMKHLRLLEEAGLVITRRSGREKLHFLNPVPIRLIHNRWIDKYTERRVSALVELKAELEEGKA